jgi:serine/threonine protein kinase
MLSDADMTEAAARWSVKWPSLDDRYQRILQNYCLAADLGTPAVTLDGHHLFHCVGQGAYGAAFEAHSEGQRYKLKLLVEDKWAFAEWWLRVILELKAGSQIRSPYVARLTDLAVRHADHCATPLVYLLGEWVDGAPPTPEDFAGNPLRLLHACRAMAEGLVAIHREKMCYRDAKPTNFILNGCAGKWIDLGQVRMPLNGANTQRDSPIGTRQYLAPEGVGNALELVERSDIFSLGVILYWLMTGKHPFKPGDQNIGALYDFNPLDEAPFSPEFKDLVRGLLNVTVDQRPAVVDVTRAVDRLLAQEHSAVPCAGACGEGAQVGPPPAGAAPALPVSQTVPE